MMRRIVCLFSAVALLTGACSTPSAISTPRAGIHFYVTSDGNDTGDGSKARPYASLERARDAVRDLKRKSGLPKDGVAILVAGGNYFLKSPLGLSPEDSGTAEAPVVFCGDETSRPVISAGRKIAGWKKVSDGLWAADIPEVKAGRWYFEQLWVNGRRATPARSPNDGYFFLDLKGGQGVDPATGKLADLSTRSFYARTDGDIAGFAKLSGDALHDVQATILWNNWITGRLRVESVDAAQRFVLFTGEAGRSSNEDLERGTRYFVSGFRDALDAPGEWFLDRAGTLLYRPRPGEDMNSAEVIAPVHEKIVVLEGDPKNGKFVEHVSFRGLAFVHADLRTPEKGISDGQSAASVAAAIEANGARHIVFENCEIAHVGGTAIHLHRGCAGAVVRHCYVHDLGAGGIQVGVNTPGRLPAEWERPSNITIEDNIICSGGRVHPNGCGILFHQGADARIEHNRISDFFYSGISAGWIWDYSPSGTRNIRIANNHIGHVGQGVLSDLAGIYTLGPMPGSEITGNLIHDVYCQRYGAFGIYNDQGTTGVRVHRNVVFDCQIAAYNMNWAMDCTLENNIFISRSGEALQKGTGPWESSFAFRHNIVWSGPDAVMPTHILPKPEFVFSSNLYFVAGGKTPFIAHKPFNQWQALGKDAGSIVADPMFVDLEHNDFRLRPESPAAKIGFQPFDIGTAGVRGDAKWKALAASVPTPARESYPIVPELNPLTINEDFENTPVGSPPALPCNIIPSWNWRAMGMLVAVSDTNPAGGKHCLKINEEAKGNPNWQPATMFKPFHVRGITTLSFDVRVERDGDLALSMQNRSGSGPYNGVYMKISRDKISIHNHGPVKIPESKWIHLEITIGLGPQRADTYDLVITPAGGPRQELRGLKKVEAGWEFFDWLEFASTSDGNATVYLDNLKLTNSVATEDSGR